MNKKITRTIEIARLLQPTKMSGKNFHVSAAFKKSKMVGLAWNTYDDAHLTHVFGEYGPTRGGENYNPGRHSECQLLKKLRMPTEDLIIVNVRLGKNGEPMIARCCGNCERVLREKKFKKLLYTINNKEYGILV